MTPKQFGALLKKLGLSNREAARLVGRTERAIRHWLNGTRKLRGPDAVLFGLLASGAITVADIRAAKRD